MHDERPSTRSIGAPLVAMASLALALGLAIALWRGRAGDVGTPEGAPMLPAAQVDVNRADAATLSALQSIGPTLSRRIVEDRSANGPYAQPEDLLRVKGITAELLARIRPFLTGFTRANEQTRPEADS